ncbi:hypothetical protein OCU04_007338 [Sclerotinia nivalis]|uniref:Uncharacterized protein n=1 Tax=Sclerotinia nivalis TaxID=352851 RepID=A0A9X0AIJ6_9HELO|nr:hypothetical protein OCU04_007338 [Sclerotinia nivalis]
MYTFVPPSFQAFGTNSIGENALNREQIKFFQRTSAFVCNENILEGTLPSLDHDIWPCTPPTLCEIGNNTPSFDLGFFFNDSSIYPFARRADLIHHQQSLHCPKAPCIYSSMGCSYATGRTDKVKEHIIMLGLMSFVQTKSTVIKLRLKIFCNLRALHLEWSLDTCDLSNFERNNISFGSRNLEMRLCM